MNKIKFTLITIHIILASQTVYSMRLAQSPLPNEGTVKVISEKNIPGGLAELTHQRTHIKKKRAEQLRTEQQYENPQWDREPFYSPAQGIRSGAAQAQDPRKFEHYTRPLGF
jgi:hypothetical protein